MLNVLGDVLNPMDWHTHTHGQVGKPCHHWDCSYLAELLQVCVFSKTQPYCNFLCIYWLTFYRKVALSLGFILSVIFVSHCRYVFFKVSCVVTSNSLCTGQGTCHWDFKGGKESIKGPNCWRVGDISDLLCIHWSRFWETVGRPHGPVQVLLSNWFPATRGRWFIIGNFTCFMYPCYMMKSVLVLMPRSAQVLQNV